MKEYPTEEENILEEKRNFFLSLRKRKINFKLFEGRNISRFNTKNSSNIFDSENDNIMDSQKKQRS